MISLLLATGNELACIVAIEMPALGTIGIHRDVANYFEAYFWVADLIRIQFHRELGAFALMACV
jgi:hypothetical protein